jgi:hypothetical protein
VASPSGAAAAPRPLSAQIRTPGSTIFSTRTPSRWWCGRNAAAAPA